jgi:quinoprotein glucose dehydrogenase
MLTENELPAIKPPWSELVAYDMNEGTIKWRVPNGTAPGLVALGITNTGAFRSRASPVVTAGGLVFLASRPDGMLRAFDKENGRVLWQYEVDVYPQGIPAVYEVNGRQYVVFAAGAGDIPPRRGPGRKAAQVEAQGYYAFALPR